MKKLVILIALIAALAAAASSAGTSSETLVVISDIGVTPQRVDIRPGDTVTWKNQDNVEHQVISTFGSFKSPVLKPGEKFSHVFEIESSYFYRVGAKLSQSAGGTVNVLGTRPTIGLTRRTVVYGNPIRVFGSIPSGASDELVTIHINPRGGRPTTRLVTTQDGAYELRYTPKVRTEFYATWDGATSLRTPAIRVRPLVIFRPISLRRNLFFVRVKAGRSYARKPVRVQHYNARRVPVTTKIVRLNRNSQARFKGKFAPGRTRARVTVAKKPGYEFGFSAIRTVRR
jgi:plastocyanin